jgi:hypothetical protein
LGKQALLFEKEAKTLARLSPVVRDSRARVFASFYQKERFDFLSKSVETASSRHACSAIRAPKPRDAPVMNQVLATAGAPLRIIGFLRACATTAQSPRA